MIDPSVAAGDPIAYAAQQQAQEELLEAAAAALDWLYDRRAHLPEDLAAARVVGQGLPIKDDR